ncbi:unnamed protein product [Hymenolepis diminuta]|nr:unnamed protein product [Hymenolepis diminuta]
MSQRVKQPNFASSSTFPDRNVNTPSFASDTRKNPFTSRERISSCISNNSDDTCITISVTADSESTEKSIAPITCRRKTNLKSLRRRLIPGRQNSNAQNQIRETIAEIRQSIGTINQNRDEIHQERKDSKLIDMLADIRDSLIAMPNEGLSTTTTDGEVMKAVEDIRKSISLLRDPFTSKRSGGEILKMGKARKSEVKPTQNDVLMDAILEIQEGVKDLEDNIQTQEDKETEYVSSAESDIQPCLKLFTDGDINTFPSNINLAKSTNTVVTSINKLIKTLDIISRQLELIYKGEGGDKSERKMKGTISTESISEKLDKYMDNKKKEAARPYQFVLPPFVPPPIFIAPYFRPSLPSYQSAQPQTAPLTCYSMSEGQSSPSGLKQGASSYYGDQSSGSQNKHHVRDFPTSFTLSFVGNEGRNGRSDYPSDCANRIFLCNEI